MPATPSFTATVRDQLARVRAPERSQRLAELAGIALTAARWDDRGTAGLAFTATSAVAARKILALLREDLGAGVHVTIPRSPAHRGRKFTVRIPGAEAAGRVLAELGLSWGPLTRRIPRRIYGSRAAAAACLRGMFIGAGHLHPPQRGYHLEILLHGRDLAGECRALMVHAGLWPGVVPRRGGYAVYLKDGDQVVRFLSATGAHAAVLAYEDVRVRRELRGQVNRLVNAETANMEKAITAAARQVRDILFLADRLDVDALPRALREIAGLRLEHPNLSLRELGLRCRPPLSKSAVAHRIRRLQRLARELGGARGRGSRARRAGGKR